ncbi:hypothetical protein [Hansschlegelia sp. KR7-227]|uniref:hypothetical protein n=1 Tax=Hansschlegelia sp. KR7-227 TaxID=3400914 RepID=UPI003C00A0F6
MRHGPRFDRSIEGAKQQVVGHRVERLGRLQLLRRWLEKRELVAFLFGAKHLERAAFFRRQAWIGDTQISELRLDADHDAIRSVVAIEAANPAVEQLDEFVEAPAGQHGFQKQRIVFGFDQADELVGNGEIAIERLEGAWPVAEAIGIAFACWRELLQSRQPRASGLDVVGQADQTKPDRAQPAIVYGSVSAQSAAGIDVAPGVCKFQLRLRQNAYLERQTH